MLSWFFNFCWIVSIFLWIYFASLENFIASLALCILSSKEIKKLIDFIYIYSWSHIVNLVTLWGFQRFYMNLYTSVRVQYVLHICLAIYQVFRTACTPLWMSVCCISLMYFRDVFHLFFVCPWVWSCIHALCTWKFVCAICFRIWAFSAFYIQNCYEYSFVHIRI